MSHWKKAVLNRHLIVVDDLLINPGVPERLQAEIHAMILATLVKLGEFHGMTVMFLDDLDI